MNIYLVGGAVRDLLMGQTPKDKDWVVVGASVQQMLDKGFKMVGADFPVFLHPESGEEYALARTERKNGKGYNGFQVCASPEVTLEEDLARRDLTMNAIAMHEDGSLVDPFGGADDIKNKVIRHTTEAFSEDPVRVLRVARFFSRYREFSIAEETRAKMTEICRSGELDALTAERVWKELTKTLECPAPWRFFEVLHETECLEAILPEIDCLFGVPQPAEHHPEIDTGVHVMMVLQRVCELSQSALVRWGALVHDLGKGVTDKALWPSHHEHEKLGIEVVDRLCDRLRVPSEYRSIGRLASEFHQTIHRLKETRAGTVVKMLCHMDAFRKPERVAMLAMIAEADARGRLGLEDRAYPQAQMLLTAFEASKQVDVRTLAGKFQGQKLGLMINQERIRLVKETLLAFTS